MFNAKIIFISLLPFFRQGFSCIFSDSLNLSVIYDVSLDVTMLLSDKSSLMI